MKTALSALLQRLGYELHRVDPFYTPRSHRFGYDLEEDARRAIDIVRANTMLPYVRLLSLYQQVAYCEQTDLRGSLVECGTWKGGAVGLMALANLAHGSTRRDLHLFDSFEGLPEPDERVDGQRALEMARRAGAGTTGRLIPVPDDYVSLASLEATKQLLENTISYDAKSLHYHQGWFQEVVPAVAPTVGDIAILRLDGDWYASTRACLEHLYDSVVPGGFVIVDDYGTYDGCRLATEEFLQRLARRPFLHHVDPCCRYWIKQ